MADTEVMQKELGRLIDAIAQQLLDQGKVELHDVLASLLKIQDQVLREDFNTKRRAFFEEFEILYDFKTDFDAIDLGSQENNYGLPAASDSSDLLCDDPTRCGQNLFSDEDRQNGHQDYCRMVRSYLVEYGCTHSEVDAMSSGRPKSCFQYIQDLQGFEANSNSGSSKPTTAFMESNNTVEKHRTGEVSRYFEPTITLAKTLHNYADFERMMRNFSVSGYYLRQFIQGRDPAVKEIFETLKQVQTPARKYWEHYTAQQTTSDTTADVAMYRSNKYKDAVLNSLVTTERREKKNRAPFDVDFAECQWQTLIEEPDMNVSAHHDSAAGVTVLRTMLCLDVSVERALEMLYTFEGSRRSRWDKLWSTESVDDVAINARKPPQSNPHTKPDHAEMIAARFGPLYPFGEPRKILPGTKNVVTEGEKFVRISTQNVPGIVKFFCDVPDHFVSRIVTRKTKEFGDDVCFYGGSMWDEDTDTSLGGVNAVATDRAGLFRKIGENRVVFLDLALTAGLRAVPYWVVSRFVRISLLPMLKENVERFNHLKNMEDKENPGNFSLASAAQVH